MRPPPSETLAYFLKLAVPAPDAFLELRLRAAGSHAMRRRFFRADRPDIAAAFAVALAGTHDVFAGCVPRRRKASGKRALERVSMLWVDCDDAPSVAALERFRPAPAVIVRSSERGAHAYWPLATPVDVSAAERGNRRLAHTLGACESAVVNAAAILRPPGTLNHKYEPPEPVRLLRCTDECFDAESLVGPLADERFASERVVGPLVDERFASERVVGPLAGSPAPRRAPRDRSDDPLLAVAPADYFQALFGLSPGRDGKLSCPFHSDTDPSLHCYSTADAGWYCFGCGIGGDIYTLGELKFGIPARGLDFVRLRERIRNTIQDEETRPWRPSTVSC